MTETFAEIRRSVRALCTAFPGAYWRELDRERRYPEAFVRALTDAGFLAALIPVEYGGSGLGIGAAAAILEEIQKSGGNGAACHAQMYTMGTVLRHGSDGAEGNASCRRSPPAACACRRSASPSRPAAPTPAASAPRRPRRRSLRGQGQKVWTSRAEHSDLMLLLARTTPREAVEKPHDGLSVFLVDMRAAAATGSDIRPIRAMINHATSEVFFDGLRMPADSLVGEEGKGFRYILDGMNAERILIAAECIGDARWFIDKATKYARERVVFGRPIGQNQGIQFPIARAYAASEAASLMVDKAAALFDAGEPCGPKPTWRSCSPPTPRGRPPTCACRPTAASALPRNTTWSASSARPGSTRWRRSRPT
jgi:acyl-CoA dehydrogenase